MLDPLEGCARTYGPQKGATPPEIDRAEAAYVRFAETFRQQTLDNKVRFEAFGFADDAQSVDSRHLQIGD